MASGGYIVSDTWVPTDQYEYGLYVIADAIQAVRLSQYALTSNYGEEPYENDVFAMRTYCWCDSDKPGHEEECPPNFEHFKSGLKVTWYKYNGRAMEANMKMSFLDFALIVSECVESLKPQQTKENA